MGLRNEWLDVVSEANSHSSIGSTYVFEVSLPAMTAIKFSVKINQVWNQTCELLYHRTLSTI